MNTGRILVMRHAEKLPDLLNPDLSPAGQERAQRLVEYIPQTFGKPDFLFATAFSKHSHRPFETIKPLSKAINVAIDATFADQDYGALAQELLSSPQFEGKLTLVCWHHGNIPPMANVLKAPAGSYPDPWPSLVFNLILQFDFAAGTPTVTKMTEPF